MPPPSVSVPPPSRCHRHHHHHHHHRRLPPPRFCWRHLLQEFGTRYRVVALDLRGYGASEKPPGRDSYRLEVLLEDVRQVIEILGTPKGQSEVTAATGATAAASPKCILVGHDWGGLLAWELAASHPAMVEKLVIMDAPSRAVMAGKGWLLGDRVGHPGLEQAIGWRLLWSWPWVGAGSRGVPPPVVAWHGCAIRDQPSLL